MDRMTDKRLAVLEKELMRTPLQPYQQKAIELLQAMKAERERIEALEAELAESCRDMRDEFLGQCPIAGELQARLDAIAALEIVEVMEILEQGDGNT